MILFRAPRRSSKSSNNLRSWRGLDNSVAPDGGRLRSCVDLSVKLSGGIAFRIVSYFQHSKSHIRAGSQYPLSSSLVRAREMVRRCVQNNEKKEPTSSWHNNSMALSQVWYLPLTDRSLSVAEPNVCSSCASCSRNSRLASSEGGLCHNWVPNRVRCRWSSLASSSKAIVIWVIQVIEKIESIRRHIQARLMANSGGAGLLAPMPWCWHAMPALHLITLKSRFVEHFVFVIPPNYE